MAHSTDQPMPELGNLHLQDDDANQSDANDSDVPNNPEDPPTASQQPRAQSGWLKEVGSWIDSNRRQGGPINQQLSRIAEEYYNEIASLLDELTKELDIEDLTDADKEEVLRALSELEKTIVDETDGLELALKEMGDRGGAYFDLVKLGIVVNELVRGVNLESTANRVKDTLEAVGGESPSSLSKANSKLQKGLESFHKSEDMEPVMKWAEKIMAVNPPESLLDFNSDILTPEMKSEFGSLDEGKKWVVIATIAAAAVLSIPLLSTRAMPQKELQEALAVCSGIPSMAAAAAIQADMSRSDALSILELGRGIIASQRYETREDLTNLKEKGYLELATEFEAVRDKLDSFPLSLSAEALPAQGEMETERLKARQELKRVIKEIRKINGCENFLLPPKAEELRKAAVKGPIIVVNVASFRCDAILIRPGSEEITSIPLEGLKKEDIEKWLVVLQNEQMRKTLMGEILVWLWNAVAEPVLNELGFSQAHDTSQPWPRVWWVLTGLLSLFPIHAAGKHADPIPGRTVIDRVVSSYSPTVKALYYARKSQTKMSPLEDDDKIVLVSMTGEKLNFVEKEIGDLEKLLPTPTVLQTPSRDEILKHLNKCKIFHYAGHAQSDLKDPSQSRLVVTNAIPDPVTVLDVTDLKLYKNHTGNPPLLAYLSACSTADNRVADLIDEGIHVVGAFQLAGFQHVIGSLWELSDENSPRVAYSVYSFIKEPKQGESVALALHNALRKLRPPRIGKKKDFGKKLTRDVLIQGVYAVITLFIQRWA